MSMNLLGKLEVGGKQFTMNDSQGTVYLKNLGLPDNFYGGYVKEARKTVYGIYMLINGRGDIVNLGYTEDSLTEKGRLLLGVKPVEVKPREEFVAEVIARVEKAVVKPRESSLIKPAGRPRR